jgi:cell division protein FtsB
MTTENWITIIFGTTTVVGIVAAALYRVIMRDVKGMIREQFGILREEKIRELHEENQRKEDKINRLQEYIKDTN